MLPKHVIIVFYKHHENHNDILEVFKDYLEKVPCVQFTDPNNKCECCIIPNHRGVKSVLHYVDNGINNIDYFQMDIFEHVYSSISGTHSYVALMLYRSRFGLLFSHHINITSDYRKLLGVLSED